MKKSNEIAYIKEENNKKKQNKRVRIHEKTRTKDEIARYSWSKSPKSQIHEPNSKIRIKYRGYTN